MSTIPSWAKIQASLPSIAELRTNAWSAWSGITQTASDVYNSPLAGRVSTGAQQLYTTVIAPLIAKIGAVTLATFAFLVKQDQKVLLAGFAATWVATVIAMHMRSHSQQATHKAALKQLQQQHDIKMQKAAEELKKSNKELADTHQLTQKQLEAANAAAAKHAAIARELIPEVSAGIENVKAHWKGHQKDHNVQVKEYHTDAELQAALVATTKAYTDIRWHHATAIQDAKNKAIDAMMAAEPYSVNEASVLQGTETKEAALYRVRTTYAKKVDALFTMTDNVLAMLTKEVQDIADIKRGDILNCGNNRRLAAGAGANNTFYCEADNNTVAAAVANSSTSIRKSLESSVAWTFHRAPKDGIGAAGGLTETIKRIFPKFDATAFNDNGNSMKEHFVAVTTKANDDLKNPATGKHLHFQLLHTIKAADIMLTYMADKTNADSRKAVQEVVDDLLFDADGNVSLNLNAESVGKKALARECLEESSEIKGLPALILALQKANKYTEGSPTLVIGGENVVDEVFLRREFGITVKKDAAQLVYPQVFGTRVTTDSMKTFATGVEELAKDQNSFVSAVNGGEMAGCEVLPLNELRLRGGVRLSDGMLLSKSIPSDREFAGVYAAKYEHELNVYFVASVQQLQKAAQGDSQNLQKALVRMAKEDQEAVFASDKVPANKKYKISHLESAKVMFAAVYDKETRNSGTVDGKGSGDIRNLMYDMFAEVINPKGMNNNGNSNFALKGMNNNGNNNFALITGAMIRAMDDAAEQVVKTTNFVTAMDVLTKL